MRGNNEAYDPFSRSTSSLTLCHRIPAILSNESQYAQRSCPCFSLHQISHSNRSFSVRDPVVIRTKGTGKRINGNNRVITRKREGRRKQSRIGRTVLRTRNGKATSQVFRSWKYSKKVFKKINLKRSKKSQIK